MIDIDLYKKYTDKNQYLLSSSCHPASTIKSIPYSLSLRIVRTCINQNTRDKSLKELKEMLIHRSYSEKIIDSSIMKAKAIPRKVLLRENKKKKESPGPVLVHTYDPRLPSFSNIQAKLWRTMTAKDTYLKEVFPKTPFTGYRRQPNIRNFIIRAKVPDGNHLKRKIRGMGKCGKSCPTCP